MIVKSKARRTDSFKQLLRYMADDKGRAMGAHAFVLTHNVKGNSIDEWASQLEANERVRKRHRTNMTKVVHEILSFHIEDSHLLTAEKLERITRQYIEMRAPNGMFVAIPHTHDDHIHVHICGSPLEYLTGKSIRMSRSDFKNLKVNIQRFQFNEYPELSHSIVQHDPP